MNIFRRETKYIFESVFEFLLILLTVIPWLVGIILASSGWLKFLAIIFPMYSWYLTVKKIMMLNGLI
jgi:hypothetical protein